MHHEGDRAPRGQVLAVVADNLVLLHQGRLATRRAPDAVLRPATLANVFGVTLNANARPINPWMFVQA